MADDGTERHGNSSNVKVEVMPRVCFHDAPTSINVSGLMPYSAVTLSLTTYNDAGQQFQSFAHYLSDERGKVDVEHTEALGGAYTGVFPAGLLSTLRETEPPLKQTRLQKDDPTSPWRMTLLAHEGHLTLEQSIASKGIASVLLERHLMAPGVQRKPVVHKRLRGTLFVPAGPGPHPAIIDIFGGFGGLKEYRASMLASKGFACLAIAYFNYGDLPKTLTTLDIEYFEEAVEYILQQPNMIPDRCGVLATSKGANIGLAMGIWLPKVTAVICIGGLLVGDTTTTYQGRELWKAAEMDNAYDIDKDNIISINKGAMKMLTHDHPSMPPCEIAPEDTHFLLISGEDDSVPSKLALEAMASRMRLYGRENQCHTIVYSGVGHIIEPPYNTHAHQSMYNLPGLTTIMKWGGEPLATCRAQEDNWHNMQKFINMHVRDRSVWYQQHIRVARGEGKL